MFKHYFEQVEGVATMPLISLIIFFVFFLALAFWVLRANKQYIQSMEALPLEDGVASRVNPKDALPATDAL